MVPSLQISGNRELETTAQKLTSQHTTEKLLKASNGSHVPKTASEQSGAGGMGDAFPFGVPRKSLPAVTGF